MSIPRRQGLRHCLPRNTYPLLQRAVQAGRLRILSSRAMAAQAGLIGHVGAVVATRAGLERPASVAIGRPEILVVLPVVAKLPGLEGPVHEWPRLRCAVGGEDAMVPPVAALVRLGQVERRDLDGLARCGLGLSRDLDLADSDMGQRRLLLRLAVHDPAVVSPG